MKPTPVIQISIQRMVCTGCGAEANASCNGARGGAPNGRANGSYKHGLYTHEAKAARRLISDLLRQCRKTIAVAGDNHS
jgi:hypothetical protein